ncbi:LIC_11321 family protein [Leptospira sp. 'Mane']|uniref:LIC_11321 family protein n=1 Tax=Leptospira sp. 'Mane' TaxID=3387407 RepID=UPI00398B1BC2
MVLKVLFPFSLFLLISLSLFSQSELPPTAGDLKGQDRSVIQPPERKEKKGCCKIKYPAGGYDFFLSTEEACRSSLYFDRYLGENNTLCLRWEED